MNRPTVELSRRREQGVVKREGAASTASMGKLLDLAGRLQGVLGRKADADPQHMMVHAGLALVEPTT